MAITILQIRNPGDTATAREKKECINVSRSHIQNIRTPSYRIQRYLAHQVLFYRSDICISCCVMQ